MSAATSHAVATASSAHVEAAMRYADIQRGYGCLVVLLHLVNEPLLEMIAFTGCIRM